MKNLQIVGFVALLLTLIFSACQEEGAGKESTSNKKATKIFEQLSSKSSGITFSNDLKEDSIVNYFTYPYIYMGGGVAIGDVNNDGLQDIFFTGNMVKNRLYLNKGDLKFEDITAAAKVGGDDRWMTGVTMADVNADGWTDIYVSVSGKFTTTKNLLYLNNGIDEKGIPIFTEGAEQAGIADEGHSTQGTFFDYDKDGDLDLYVANYPPTGFKTSNFAYQMSVQTKNPKKSDRLYRNDGTGSFEDVSDEAGILNFGLSLSATVGDYNNDGWEDIYVSNDFATPDYFFFNNGDGTFSEKAKETTQHTAFFGMGADAGDFNNDGLLDIVQLDMTPENNRRSKANMASMNPAGFWEIVNMGMHYQYMQNALQLNQGIGEDGLPRFSDIARIADMSSTDWSWSALFADLDNDGWKDVFVTNGTRRDINNKDYFNRIEKATYQEKKKFNYFDLTIGMPSEKVENYTFRNNGDLTFEKVGEAWGLDFSGFSNGAAYADLDNDGDLEVVINNIDEDAVIFYNKSTELGKGNFLLVNLQGSAQNPQGLGAKLYLSTKNGLQYQHITLSRGFQSAVAPVGHFGLNDLTTVDKLAIVWPDGKSEEMQNVSVNQVVTFDYKNAKENAANNFWENNSQKLFSDFTAESGIDYLHVENAYNDYAEEVLLPHGYSTNGPGLAVGDVNGDGLEDFYIGGAIGSSGALFVQRDNGKFQASENGPWKADINQEDMGALLFDAEGDGDLDLYVISGGNENDKGSDNLSDRLYVNDGAGNFEKSSDALPEMKSSGSRVKTADFDGDGDLDLFVGGRILPKSYPLPAKSYILKNESTPNGGIKFIDVTEELAPDLLEAGLVTDAAWVDYDNDEKIDLVVVGEWMPITFLKNMGGKFEDKTEAYGLEKNTGWWYSLVVGDFDKDGDMDLVAGNLGLNYKYKASEETSFDVYASDFDKNGKLDIVLGYFNDGVQYPVRGRQCSSDQIPAIKVKYKDYDSFADATLEDIYTKEDLEDALHYQAWNFASSYIQNDGDGNFSVSKLPNEVQLSSINGIIAEDFNQDGHLDLAVAGNLFASEVETTRNDAGFGCILIGDGKGGFKPLPYAESGFRLGQDTKDLAKINTPNGLVIIAANNNDKMKALLLND